MQSRRFSLFLNIFQIGHTVLIKMDVANIEMQLSWLEHHPDKVGVGGSSPLISTKISLISSDFLFSQPHLVLQSNTQSETLHQGGTLLVYASNLFDIRWGRCSLRDSVSATHSRVLSSLPEKQSVRDYFFYFLTPPCVAEPPIMSKANLRRFQSRDCLRISTKSLNRIVSLFLL